MRTRAVIALGLILGLGVAATAMATFQPVLLYDPPKIVFRDLEAHNSSEDVTVGKDGNRFVFTNTGSSGAGVGMHPDSEDGCEPVTLGVSCPVAGVKSIVVKLLTNEDAATIELGSKATKVKQKLLGGDDADTLDGGDGKQVIKGQGGGDVLTGGPGPDVINGGPGNDLCDGESGQDVIRNCEPLAPG
jgi:Ca2+-binding RTX toxin-like protein